MNLAGDMQKAEMDGGRILRWAPFRQQGASLADIRRTLALEILKAQERRSLRRRDRPGAGGVADATCPG